MNADAISDDPLTSLSPTMPCEAKHPVIHIGFHKAASTYLQSVLLPHLPVNFVFLAGYRREMLDYVQARDGFDPPRLREWVITQVGGQKEYDARCTVISHEELSGHPHGYDSVDPFVVARNLKVAYPGARILIVIRNQRDYLLSLYSFRVSAKGHEWRSFDRFLREEGKLGLLSKLKYDRIVRAYIELFGRNRVLVLPVELLRHSPARFNKTITDFMGVDPVQIDAVPIVNPSTRLVPCLNFWRVVNLGFVGLLRLCQSLKLGADEEYPQYSLRYRFYAIKRRGTAAANRIFKKAPRLTFEVYADHETLIRMYHESNTRLSFLLGTDLSEYGYF